MLKTRIKASQIANLTDARYFAAWGAEWLGFNFEGGTEGYIHPTEMQAIKEWVEGPMMVGEFGGQTTDDIIKAIDLLGLDAIQIGRFTDVQTIKLQKDIPIIKEVVLESNMTTTEVESLLENEGSFVNYFLLSFDKNNIGWEAIKNETFLSIDFLKRICEQYNVLISIESRVEEIMELLEVVSPHGLSLKGGEEEKVGVKSFDELDDIFEALEVFE